MRLTLRTPSFGNPTVDFKKLEQCSCIYVYVYLHTRFHIHICVHTCTYVHRDVHIYTYVYTCMCVCIYMYIRALLGSLKEPGLRSRLQEVGAWM